MDPRAHISAAVAASSDKPLWIRLRFMVQVFLFSWTEKVEKIANALV
jgi:hypothetical protein